MEDNHRHRPVRRWAALRTPLDEAPAVRIKRPRKSRKGRAANDGDGDPETFELAVCSTRTGEVLARGVEGGAGRGRRRAPRERRGCASRCDR